MLAQGEGGSTLETHALQCFDTDVSYAQYYPPAHAGMVNHRSSAQIKTTTFDKPTLRTTWATNLIGNERNKK